MKSYADESINIIKDAIPEEAKCYEWPPIGNNIDLPTLPDFPLHALPQVIRNMADEISKAVKVPASLAAAEILGLVGLAIGRNVHYCFKRSLTGRANLYMLIFAARGERKSSVDSIVQKPFREWLEIQSKEYQKQLEKADILQKRLDFLIGKLIKGRIGERDEEEISSEIDIIKSKLESMPPNPNIFTNNITPEALLQKLAACGGRVAVVSDDGRLQLKMILGLRYSNDGDAHDEVFLDCYDGSKTLTYDRSGRSITPVKNPCIGLVLMCQPDMLAMLGDKAEVFCSGFASRCLYCFPETWVGKRNADGTLMRDIDDYEISDRTMNEYRDLVLRLLKRSYVQTEPIYIGISTEAKEFWKEHYRQIEGESDKGGLYYETLDVAIRYTSQTLRLALLISQVEEHGKIELDDMKNAHELMLYFIANAERCHLFIRKMQLPNDAGKIVAYMMRNYRTARHDVRDIYRNTGLTKACFKQMLELLESRHYCRLLPAEKTGKPGRPKEGFIEVNPELLLMSSQDARHG